MESIVQYFQSHPLALLFLYGFISSALQSLPAPNEKSSQLYIWAHNMAQLLLANWKFMKFPNAMPKPADRP